MNTLFDLIFSQMVELLGFVLQVYEVLPVCALDVGM